MEPLLDKLDKLKTIKAVEEHLVSFSKIRHYYSVVDAEEGDVLPIKEKNEGNSLDPSQDKMLKKINRAEHINFVTQEYLEKLLKAINHLHPYSRKLILLKYFYEMDAEEIGEIIGFSERKVWSDLKDSKIDLAFLLKCEKYKKPRI